MPSDRLFRPRLLLALLTTVFVSTALSTYGQAALSQPASIVTPASTQAPPPPDLADIHTLLGKPPHLISYRVTSSSDGKWIGLSAECETAYPAPAATIQALLEDYPGASRIFSRIGWAKIVDTLPDGTIVEQYSGVKVFGIEFYTLSRFREWTSRDSDYAIVNFVQIGSDGSMRNCDGSWSIADRSQDGKSLSYLRYEISFETLAKYPGQELAMRNFGQADIIRVLNELGAAAKKER